MMGRTITAFPQGLRTSLGSATKLRTMPPSHTHVDVFNCALVISGQRPVRWRSSSSAAFFMASSILASNKRHDHRPVAIAFAAFILIHAPECYRRRQRRQRSRYRVRLEMVKVDCHKDVWNHNLHLPASGSPGDSGTIVVFVVFVDESCE